MYAQTFIFESRVSNMDRLCVFSETMSETVWAEIITACLHGASGRDESERQL